MSKMKLLIPAVSGVALAFGGAGCGDDESAEDSLLSSSKAFCEHAKSCGELESDVDCDEWAQDILDYTPTCRPEYAAVDRCYLSLNCAQLAAGDGDEQCRAQWRAWYACYYDDSDYYYDD